MNLAPLIPEEQRLTRIYRGQRQLIDHILVSHIIVRVVAEDDVTTSDTAVASIGDNPNNRRNEPGSDHRPVLVDCRL